MPIDIYTCKPEKLKDITEVENILQRMDIYKKELPQGSREIGVLKLQSRQLGPIYLISSIEKAEEEMHKPILSNPRTVEWGIKFYPRSYFVQLRKDLEAKLA